ncbi:MAG: beta-lactamase family protein [Candidatus Dormibacteraeota bacterium]|nr:beta-lactamase family protein [Candidatus Dormibacteraeota bacterium]
MSNRDPGPRPLGHEAAEPDPTLASFADPQRRRLLASAYPAVDAVFSKFRDRVRAPGIAYGSVIDGELSHAGGAGHRLAGARAEVGPDTVFRIASMTKSITAACVLMLRDEGRIALDDPVARYVPELEGQVPTLDSAAITLRQLRTMSAGLVEDDPWADRQLAMSDAEFGSRLIQGLPFNRSPPTGCATPARPAG